MLRVRRETGRAGDRAPLPQRVRPADAAGHAVCRRRGDLRERARGRPGAAGVRGRRPAARLRPRPRRRARERDRADAPEPAPGAFNVASGTPRTVGEMAERTGRRRTAPTRRTPVVTGQYRLGDVRHVFASAERAAAELGFAAREDFAAGMAEFAPRATADGGMSTRRAARDREGAAAGPREDAAVPAVHPEQAAALAAAALADTLDVVARRRATAGCSCSTATPTAGCAPGFELIAQRGDGLAERLAARVRGCRRAGAARRDGHAAADARAAARRARGAHEPDVDAVLGPALDGGYWSIGLQAAVRERVRRRPDERADDLRCAARAAQAARAARPRAAAAARRRHDRRRAGGRARRRRARGSPRRSRDAADRGVMPSRRCASTATGSTRRRERLDVPPQRRHASPLALDALAGPSRRDRRVAPARRRAGPVLDVGCGPGRHLHALAGAACSGSGSTSRRSPSSSRATAARTRSSARSSTRSRAPARGGRRCCSTATSASAAHPVRLLGACGRCCTAAARCSSSSTRQDAGTETVTGTARGRRRARADGSAGRAWRSATWTRSRDSPGSGWSLAGAATSGGLRG